MNGRARYTVIELAELVGVPRTTINDWLARHSQYIDFQTQGRRRIYTDASVKVLKEIFSLRNAGLSSYEIEAELAKRHPVRGEPEGAPRDPHAEGAEPPGAAQEAMGAEPQQDFALIAKRQSDEIGRMIGESFQGMARKIEEIERRGKEASSRAMRWYAVSFVLLVLILAAGFVAIARIEKALAAGRELKGALTEKEMQVRSLEDKVVSLAGGSEELKRNIEALEMGLVKQRAEFEKAVGDALEEAESRKAAEIAKLRDGFAARRLELLKKLEGFNGSSAEKDSLLEELKKSLSTEDGTLKAAGDERGRGPGSQPAASAPESR